MQKTKALPLSYPIGISSLLDTLSKIWLTKEALRELDRRTWPVEPHQHRRQAPQGHRLLLEAIVPSCKAKPVLRRRLLPNSCSIAPQNV